MGKVHYNVRGQEINVEVEDLVKCPYCPHTILLPGDRFCHKCGFPVDGCPKCGKTFLKADDVIFCPQCGDRLLRS